MYVVYSLCQPGSVLEHRSSSTVTNNVPLSNPTVLPVLLSGTYLTEIPKRFGYSSGQFPFTGTSVMLALRPESNYKVEVVIFGGANELAIKVRA